MKPILFNTEMVKALLDGRKTVTRRLVKQQPETVYGKQRDIVNPNEIVFKVMEKGGRDRLLLPLYQTGDILYVRETFCDTVPHFGKMPDDMRYTYKADETAVSKEAREGFGIVWTPSIHMPKAAARIFLRVTDVRVERLQDMETHDDCNYKAEGAKDKHDFIRIWDSTVDKTEELGWYANPWVWVIEFERISKEEKIWQE